jgi:hypothetical protein
VPEGGSNVSGQREHDHQVGAALANDRQRNGQTGGDNSRGAQAQIAG